MTTVKPSFARIEPRQVTDAGPRGRRAQPPSSAPVVTVEPGVQPEPGVEVHPEPATRRTDHCWPNRSARSPTEWEASSQHRCRTQTNTQRQIGSHGAVSVVLHAVTRHERPSNGRATKRPSGARFCGSSRPTTFRSSAMPPMRGRRRRRPPKKACGRWPTKTHRPPRARHHDRAHRGSRRIVAHRTRWSRRSRGRWFQQTFSDGGLAVRKHIALSRARERVSRGGRTGVGDLARPIVSLLPLTDFGVDRGNAVGRRAGRPPRLR